MEENRPPNTIEEIERLGPQVEGGARGVKTTPLGDSVTPNKRMDARQTLPFLPPPTHASLNIENRRASVHAGFGRRDAENYLVDRFRSQRQRGGGGGKGRRYTARTAFSPQALLRGSGSPILAARPRKCCLPISRLAL